MKVKLAKTAGFCMGVRRAVEMVLDAANSQQGPIYTYGPLIHNPQVLEILAEKGVTILQDIAHDISGAKLGSVVIRAHGAPPQARQALVDAGFTIIDATCPRVIKVQTIISRHAKQGYAAIIVGDKDHPEVVGLLGYAKGMGHVITRPEDLDKLPHFERAIVVAQTTQDGQLFDRIARTIAARFPHFQVFNTICDSTLKRQAEVREMSKTVDAVVVVGGRNSGNTQRLAQVVEQKGVPAFHVESEAELDREAIESLNAVGITAGASTPNWVIKKVYRTLEALPYQVRGQWRHTVFRIQRWLLLSNLYLALGAGCLSYTCALLSGNKPSFASALMAACYVLSMHILNNFIGKEAVRYNDPDRAGFYDHNRLLLLTLAIISGAVGLFMAFTLGPVPFLILCTISLLGIFYKVKIIPERLKIGKKIQRISDVPGSKTVLIALAWGIVTVVLPHLSVSLQMTTTLIFVSLWASVMAFVRTAFFDILDMQGDRIVGQESLPIVLGERRTFRILKQLLVIFLAAHLFAPMMQLATTLAYGMILSVFYMAAVLMAFERHWIVPGFRFEFLVETLFVFTAVVSGVWQVFAWGYFT
ncbi:MAG: 4-hydroxy-3-methylbut-2-enyl diphosphate reductase [Deltaproteobacteria bacterium]|nr:4-hydroxy-3-methylbut-2-enyl diphosphate reductase [Deltaproteobacteria bacterium]MBW2075563.1 4-hydroxy-3-methylbut-2-enyl diphosphate reductase [Deltaproteobacteria bacterium]RLB79896.1 MAG: 4-hydroxy-3-methylbut-2-enyl diphosphate reductase [Deltaproteobacteria bacterium]